MPKFYVTVETREYRTFEMELSDNEAWDEAWNKLGKLAGWRTKDPDRSEDELTNIEPSKD